jgi:hypothetical protein
MLHLGTCANIRLRQLRTPSFATAGYSGTIGIFPGRIRESALMHRSAMLWRRDVNVRHPFMVKHALIPRKLLATHLNIPKLSTILA